MTGTNLIFNLKNRDVDSRLKQNKAIQQKNMQAKKL